MPSTLPPVGVPISRGFFDRDAQRVAADLLGLVLCRRLGRQWLMASIVEAEAYYLEDKASHASLGYTHKRRALFMPAGTIYMYYARGGDSLNVSVRGDGNAVLIKAAVPLEAEYVTGPWQDAWTAEDAAAMLRRMHRLNPLPSGAHRAPHRLCAGQALLCRSLGLRVPDWDARPLPSPGLMFMDIGYLPLRIAQTRRLGIPALRDAHLPYRFVDAGRTWAATRNPLLRSAREGVDYTWIEPRQRRHIRKSAPG